MLNNIRMIDERIVFGFNFEVDEALFIVQKEIVIILKLNYPNFKTRGEGKLIQINYN